MQLLQVVVLAALVGPQEVHSGHEPVLAPSPMTPQIVMGAPSACGESLCVPKVQYKGCPSPCSVPKLVSVRRPCSCCTLEVLVYVPSCPCEDVDIERDGDMELDYGKYEIELDWENRGRKLVVRYDD